MRGFVIICTAPDARTAKRLGRSLVEERYAACVTVVRTAESVYRWKGKIETAKEAMLFIKTNSKNFSKVEKAIRLRHPYSVPEIIGVPIQRGSKDYLKWLSACVR